MSQSLAHKIQGYIYMALSMILQTLGYVLVFKFVINAETMTALTFLMSSIIFGIIAFRKTGRILRIIWSDPWLFIRFNLYVFLMITPIFVCEIHGVKPVEYGLIFCATVGGLAALEKKAIGLHFTSYWPS